MRDPLTAQSRLYMASPFQQRRASARFAKGILFLTLAFIFCGTGRAQDPACKILPPGQEFWIRLSEPVSTYSSKNGATVQAILIESPRCHGIPVFSTGTAVQGHIAHLRRVGMGLLHASSAVAIDFDEILPGPKPLPFKAQVEEVANGREDVKRGVIEGVGGRA